MFKIYINRIYYQANYRDFWMGLSSDHLPLAEDCHTYISIGSKTTPSNGTLKSVTLFIT